MQLIEEKRLIKTMLSRKPQADSFLVAAFLVLLVTVVTLYDWRTGSDLAASKEAVFGQHEYWRLFTAVLTHSDLAHLLSNLYMLFIFGFFVYGYFGIGVMPAAALMAAVAVNGMAVLTYAPQISLLGASGLVYILGGFWLTLYFFIQRQYTLPSRLLRVTGIALMVFFPTTFAATTSYRTHAIGFAAGLLMGAGYFFLKRARIRSFEVYKTTVIEDTIYE
jgi:rhomboid protease GluP